MVRLTAESNDARRALLEAARLRGVTVAAYATGYGREYLAFDPPLDLAGDLPEGVVGFAARPIVLAIRPQPKGFMPSLFDAFSGMGRPGAVAGAEIVGDRLVLEWETTRADPALLRTLLDVEVSRRGGSFACELLVPLEPSVVVDLAGSAMQDPALDERRVLDFAVGSLDASV
jgi:hypothetical protein